MRPEQYFKGYKRVKRLRKAGLNSQLYTTVFSDQRIFFFVQINPLAIKDDHSPETIGWRYNIAKKEWYQITKHIN